MADQTSRRKRKPTGERELEAVGIRQLRIQAGDLTAQAHYGNKRIPISKGRKKDFAAIVGPEDLAILRKLDAAATG